MAQIFNVKSKLYIMLKKIGKKSGPKDKNYVNRSEKHETVYEKYRKTPAKKFGSSKKSK
jgi:hypothetical protein